MERGESVVTVTTPAEDGQVARARVRRLRLVFAPDPAASHVLVLERASVVLGREPGDGFAIPDPEISRQHARLDYDPETDGFRVVDLDSRNGVIVDGVRHQEAALVRGSVLRLGSSLLVLLDDEVPAGQALRAESPRLRGDSVAMQRIRGDLALVAAQPTSVLVVGETGVGKERVAEELHRLSRRPGRLVAVNCAAIPEALAESELFGHAPGAFTGAVARSEGLFRAAHGGTLFLDEVGELAPALQAKLLRALATGVVRAVGATEDHPVDVRVVAATHRDVKQGIASGDFRADLFARLAGWLIEIPPLSTRREDVLALAADVLSGQPSRSPLSASAAEALLLHDWPFNVRELRHTIEAAAVRASGGPLLCEHLPAALAARVQRGGPAMSASAAIPLELVIDRSVTPSRQVLERVLAHYQGSVLRVAEFYGKHRRQIYRWLERHGITADPSADSAEQDPR